MSVPLSGSEAKDFLAYSKQNHCKYCGELSDFRVCDKTECYAKWEAEKTDGYEPVYFPKLDGQVRDIGVSVQELKVLLGMEEDYAE